MHDVLVHYIEVNFAEIAEQLARASGREPGSKERSEAAERLRSLIRRLRRDAEASQWKNHEPRVTTSEMIAGVNGELRPEERRVLDHFFDLFARSMQRTQAASVPEPAAEEAAVEPAQPAQEAPPAAVAPEPALTDPAAPAVAVVDPALAEADAEEPTTAEAEPTAEPPAAPSIEPPPTPMPAEIPAARLVPEQTAGPLQTILLAAAQQALDLLQVDASQVYTLGDQRRFVLRAGVPTESLAAPEGTAALNSRLLRQALDNNEVVTVEDLSSEELTPDQAAWVDVGFRGFAAIALSPPLERPVGVLALLRRTPWRLDRRDAVRLEDLAVEAVAALRAHSLAIEVAEVAVLQERL